MTTQLPLWLLRDSAQAVMLRTVATPVSLDHLTDQVFQKMIDDMVVTMYQADGIGLAAPQIGQSIRLAVIAQEVDELPAPLVMVNPVISNYSTEQETVEEGCLSIPGVFGPVSRSRTLELTALDRFGKAYRLTAHGLFARVIQHEVDHLNGRLFIDRAEKITRGKKLL